MSLRNRVLRQVRPAPTLRDAAAWSAKPCAPRPGQVLVRQHFAGVNGVFHNTLARGGLLRAAAAAVPPRVEVVGAMDAVGEVRDLVPGDAVLRAQLDSGYSVDRSQEPQDVLDPEFSGRVQLAADTVGAGSSTRSPTDSPCSARWCRPDMSPTSVRGDRRWSLPRISR